MALLHECLYRPGLFATVELAAYLRELATHALHTRNRQADPVPRDARFGRRVLPVNQPQQRPRRRVDRRVGSTPVVTAARSDRERHRRHRRGESMEGCHRDLRARTDLAWRSDA